MILRFLTPALEEFDGTIAYYQEIDHQLSNRYLAEAERVIALITENPERFRQRADGYRYAKLRKFSYHNIYSVVADEIVVAAVSHMRRKPGYWIDRID